MTLTQLSHYSITGHLGAGGMGEVYRAHDTKLARDVALKLLPESFASDPERLARFDREARLLASLNHPGVGAIYGFEEAAGRRFLVLELVEGEDLSDRITRGPLPVDEAVGIATQVADALEAAHDRGVVHRDLKPANVKLTPDGKVKVLDFGLARAWADDGAAEASALLSHSPTLAHPATEAGLILGTAAYMAPEQARGKPVDRRADVWALGVVLFEMLAGKRPFAGDTVSDMLAAVIKDEPDWSLLPPALPAGVASVLRRCLVKEPAQRLRDVADVRILLADDAAPPVAPPETAARPRWRDRMAAALAGASAATAVALALVDPAGETDTPLTAFAIPLQDDRPVAFLDVPALAFSPDGRSLAFTAVDPGGESTIRLRRLDRTGTRAVEGTERGSAPFFSPDGGTLGFFSDGRLRTVPLAGGPVVTLAEAPTHRGAVWQEDGSILFSPEYAAGLWRVPAAGGPAELVVAPRTEEGERTFRWPGLLPGGRGVVFTVGFAGSPNDYGAARIEAHSFETGRRHVLVEKASMARFLPPDILLFAREEGLYAIRLDLDRLETRGAPAAVERGVAGSPSSGASHFAVALDGTLALVRGTGSTAARRLAIVDSEGVATTLPLSTRGFRHPRFSPDGTRLAFSVEGTLGSGAAPGVDVWTYSLEEGSLSRLTFESRWAPVWSADGRRIAYLDPRSPSILAKAADGSGAEESLGTIEGRPALPGSWSREGRLALTVLGPSTDVYLLTPGEEPELFEADASRPALSPNGRWIAYSSPAVGAANVFVREVDGPGKWQVSPDLGGTPRWSGDGRELFYVSGVGFSTPQRPLVVVPVAAGDTFSTGPQRVVIPDLRPYLISTSPHFDWDVAPDGDRFVFIEVEGRDNEANQIEVSLGWRRRAAQALAGAPVPDE